MDTAVHPRHFNYVDLCTPCLTRSFYCPCSGLREPMSTGCIRPLGSQSLQGLTQQEEGFRRVWIPQEIGTPEISFSQHFGSFLYLQCPSERLIQWTGSGMQEEHKIIHSHDSLDPHCCRIICHDDTRMLHTRVLGALVRDIEIHMLPFSKRQSTSVDSSSGILTRANRSRPTALTVSLNDTRGGPTRDGNPGRITTNLYTTWRTPSS